MRKILSLFLICLSSIACAQGSKYANTSKNISPEPPTQIEQFGFTAEKQAPRYVGGKEAMSKFIYSKMQYPQDAKAKGIQGDVQLNFFVDVDGTLLNITVVKGVCESIDAEALRVVKTMPKWLPGKNGSVNILMKSSLIIGFHL